ncbi:hypothetical protein B0H13DRAFT_1918498 [Mycena leptocephala]|nr:hypothetical protein B0H13DRAFT_1918498 [Mycena leptocephala]
MAQRIDDAGPEARVVCGGQQHRIPWHQLWWRRLPASFQPPTSPELDGVKGRQSRWRVSDSSALTRVPDRRLSSQLLCRLNAPQRCTDKRGNDRSKTHQGRGRGHLNGTGAECKGAGGSRDKLRKAFQRRLGIASSAEIVSWKKRGTGEERVPLAGVGSRSDTMRRETMWSLALVEANSNMEMDGQGAHAMSTRRGTHWASSEVDTALNGAGIVPPRRPVEAHTGPLMGCVAFMCPIPGMAMQNTEGTSS